MGKFGDRPCTDELEYAVCESITYRNCADDWKGTRLFFLSFGVKINKFEF